MDDTPVSLRLALDLRRGRDPFKDFGLVVKEDDDAVDADDFGLVEPCWRGA